MLDQTKTFSDLFEFEEEGTEIPSSHERDTGILGNNTTRIPYGSKDKVLLERGD